MGRKIQLPKLPRGQGGMHWDNRTKDLIVYQKSHTFSNGKMMRISVTGYTPQECISRMDEKISITENELKKSNAQKEDSKGRTLTQAMSQWLVVTKKDKVKNKTYDRYENTLLNQICKYDIGKLQVYSITRYDIETYIQTLSQSNLSYSSIKKSYELLKQFMAYLYEKDISSNPMNGLSLPKKKADSIELTSFISDKNLSLTMSEAITIKDILDDDEIKQFKKEACKEYKVGVGGYRYGRIFYFMILTFPRIGEMLAIRWKDIDFENKTMRIDKSISTIKNRDINATTKTKRVVTTPKSLNSIREVMLTDEAIKVLLEHKELMSPKSEDDFVCTTIHGTVASDRVLYDSLKLIMKNSGIQKENFSPHNLRHTGISYYIRHGVPIDVIANMAGHDVSVAQKVYYHIIQSQKNSALEIMNKISVD